MLGEMAKRGKTIQAKKSRLVRQLQPQLSGLATSWKLTTVNNRILLGLALRGTDPDHRVIH